jgi:ferrous iron transport protein A
VLYMNAGFIFNKLYMPDSSQLPAAQEASPPPKSLADLAVGQGGTIARVDGPRAFRRRLMELGLVPGTPVRVVNVAPLGDPLELEVRGSRLSIRALEARAIALAVERPRVHLQVAAS